MRKLVCLITILGSMLTQSLSARELTGKVVDNKGVGIPFAEVLIEKTSKGVASDVGGLFTLVNAPDHAFVLVIRSLGFASKRVQIAAGDQNVNIDPITLEDDMLGLDEVVITGTMRETFIKDSPIKVEVITAKKLLSNMPATNLMEGLQLINGVQEVNACGVCYTNSISIQGLPGAYTAILIDGTPMFGNLASVYGLNGIPTQMIDRIEVVKGPSSTLYGSEAIAGVLNIITKSPENEPLAAIDAMVTSHAETFLNSAFTSRLKKWQGFTGVNATRMNQFEDFNNDGFGDRVGMERLSLFTKWSLKRPDNKRFFVAAKYYHEDRWNGVEPFFQDRNHRTLRGNDSVYGESIYTRRLEVFGTYDLPITQNMRLDYSLSWHDQDSYYGSAHYTAKQGIAFTNLVWFKRIRKHHVTGGYTQRWQYYDDNTVATQQGNSNIPERQFIPGVFAEDEWQLRPNVTLLGGLRLDHYNAHGLIPSPRGSVKWDAGSWTTFRLNGGTGFKIVHLFTEDHAFITGQRVVEIASRLDPERSWNVSANANHVHSIGNSSGMLDVDVFYTRFTNKIIPDYETLGKIIYRNTNGFAESYGAAVQFSQQFSFPLAYQLGVNVNRTLETQLLEQGMSSTPLLFAPNLTAVLTVNYFWKKAGLALAYTVNLTGTMALPEVYDLDLEGLPVAEPRPQQSTPFSIHQCQFTKTFKHSSWELYTGVRNIFDYRQALSPLTGYNDPNTNPGFSPYFDTSYSFSPIHGREVFLGVRYKFDKRLKKASS